MLQKSSLNRDQGLYCGRSKAYISQEKSCPSLASSSGGQAGHFQTRRQPAGKEDKQGARSWLASVQVQGAQRKGKAARGRGAGFLPAPARRRTRGGCYNKWAPTQFLCRFCAFSPQEHCPVVMGIVPFCSARGGSGGPWGQPPELALGEEGWESWAGSVFLNSLGCRADGGAQRGAVSGGPLGAPVAAHPLGLRALPHAAFTQSHLPLCCAIRHLTT